VGAEHALDGAMARRSSMGAGGLSASRSGRSGRVRNLVSKTATRIPSGVGVQELVADPAFDEPMEVEPTQVIVHLEKGLVAV
jgi:hypothetical protein